MARKQHFTRSSTNQKPRSRQSNAQPLREAVLYARVSSKDQEREGFSIPAQKELLQQYAADNELAVVAEFVDVETAKRAGRTSFSQMVEYLQQRPTCRIVLVEKTDRLYRNLKDWVTLDEMPDLEIHLVKEGTILSDGSRSSEKFIHGIKVLMAKNYIDNLSEETRKGMLQKAREGIWPSRAPLGYHNIQREDGKRIIALDPVVAPHVRQIFEWYASGEHSIKQVTRMAKTAGMRFRKSQKPLPRTTIHHMLSNPLYIGEFEWNGERYTGIHEPLVSHALFKRVQDQLTGNASTQRYDKKLEFAFSGLVSCGLCEAEGEGRYLIASLIKKKYVYYHCERCKQLGRAKYHRQAPIDEAVRDSLRRLRLDAEVLEWLKVALRESMADKKQFTAEAIERLQQQYDRLQRRIDAAYEDRLDGRISIDFFERRSRGWREEQMEIRRQLAAHEAADQGYMEAGIALLELANHCVELYESQPASEKRRLLRFVYLNSFWDGEALRVVWKQPFDILADFEPDPENESTPGEGSEGEFVEWLPCLPSRRTRVPRHIRADVAEEGCIPAAA